MPTVEESEKYQANKIYRNKIEFLMSDILGGRV